MASVRLCFDRFVLDRDNRRLLRDGEPVELNARYLDALILLVSEEGRLVPKSRFFDEVWRGVPVTDEALTQCIRTLRRQLGDEATRPAFIETAPKHGYRFISPVTAQGAAEVNAGASDERWGRFVRLGLAGTAGGGLAGVLGGLCYGFAAISDPLRSAGGAMSAVVVMICLTMLVGLAGGAGVGFGMAAASFPPQARSAWTIPGAALGGFVVGAGVKLIGLDALSLLFGIAPGGVTGGPEGLMLGAATGLGAWLACRADKDGRAGRGVAAAALVCAVTGLAIALIGGRLMGGSLQLLAEAFPGSRLRLDHIGVLFGEGGFGLISGVATAAVEAALFGACVASAMVVARRRVTGA